MCVDPAEIHMRPWHLCYLFKIFLVNMLYVYMCSNILTTHLPPKLILHGMREMCTVKLR